MSYNSCIVPRIDLFAIRFGMSAKVEAFKVWAESTVVVRQIGKIGFIPEHHRSKAFKLSSLFCIAAFFLTVRTIP